MTVQQKSMQQHFKYLKKELETTGLYLFTILLTLEYLAFLFGFYLLHLLFKFFNSSMAGKNLECFFLSLKKNKGV